MSAPRGEDPHPDRMLPDRPRAYVWVRDGVATLTVITNAPEGGINWPEDAGPLILLDSSFDLTLTEIQT